MKEQPNQTMMRHLVEYLLVLNQKMKMHFALASIVELLLVACLVIFVVLTALLLLKAAHLNHYVHDSIYHFHQPFPRNLIPLHYMHYLPQLVVLHLPFAILGFVCYYWQPHFLTLIQYPSVHLFAVPYLGFA